MEDFGEHDLSMGFILRPSGAQRSRHGSGDRSRAECFDGAQRAGRRDGRGGDQRRRASAPAVAGRRCGASGAFDRAPRGATAAFAVLTRATAGELDAALSSEALAGALSAPLCGDPPACDAVRVPCETRGRSERSSAATRPAGVSCRGTGSPPSRPRPRRASGRRSLYAAVVLVRASGPATVDQLPARAGLRRSGDRRGVAWARLRRDAPPHRERAILRLARDRGRCSARPSGARKPRRGAALPARRRDRAPPHARQRGRFGAPDVEIEGAPMSARPALGALVNRVAAASRAERADRRELRDARRGRRCRPRAAARGGSGQRAPAARRQTRSRRGGGGRRSPRRGGRPRLPSPPAGFKVSIRASLSVASGGKRGGGRYGSAGARRSSCSSAA